MNLEKRIDLLAQLGDYCLSGAPAWEAAKYKAHTENGWFIPEFIETAVRNIAAEYLQKDKLMAWAQKYDLPAQPTSQKTPAASSTAALQPASQKTIGLVMAGNIPLVGFHDMLSIFISGHRQLIKTSTRDTTLIKHLVEWMIAQEPGIANDISFAERLNGCDAYIATGSNNSARYFDYYFGKYPHIIRRNRTSVALLTGKESTEELQALSDDVNLYFGLGCRNVTQLYVPENYDFIPLLDAFSKYERLADLAKYKHNYDYQLTLLILNKRYYMTDGTILLTENESPFSAISVLHYQYYRPGSLPPALSSENADIQCIVGQTPFSSANHPASSPANQTPPSPANHPSSPGQTSPQGPPLIPFGQAQHPSLDNYADGIDTLQFLRDL